MTRNFPSFIKAFLDYTTNVEAPVKFLQWSAISVLAGALERKTWINFNGKQPVYPNMFVMLIGSAGLAKKSSSSAQAIDLIKACDNLRFMSNQVTMASLISQMQEAGSERQVRFGAESFNNSSVYLYSSEAAVTLKNDPQSSISELLTDLYDCGPMWWNNKSAWSKSTISRGTELVYNPCINMLACSTQTWLQKCIPSDDIQGGFASRILFVVQMGKPERSIGWLEEQPDLSEFRAKLIHDLRLISLLQGQFKTDKAFGTMFNQLKAKQEDVILAHQQDRMIGYHSRKLWHAMKLAQILAVDNSNELKVSGSHLELAFELLSSLEAEMNQAFNTMSGNPNSNNVRQIWEYARKKPQFTKIDLTKTFMDRISTKELMEAIVMLRDMNKIQPIQIGAGIGYRVLDHNPL